MSRWQRRLEQFGNKRQRMTYAPVYRKRKTEDAHIDWLWSMVQKGMKIEFERNGKLLMSHRTLDVLISRQNQAGIEQKRKNNA